MVIVFFFLFALFTHSEIILAGESSPFDPDYPLYSDEAPLNTDDSYFDPNRSPFDITPIESDQNDLTREEGEKIKRLKNDKDDFLASYPGIPIADFYDQKKPKKKQWWRHLFPKSCFK